MTDVLFRARRGPIRNEFSRPVPLSPVPYRPDPPSSEFQYDFQAPATEENS